jgi:hypothetical protein
LVLQEQLGPTEQLALPGLQDHKVQLATWDTLAALDQQVQLALWVQQVLLVQQAQRDHMVK